MKLSINVFKLYIDVHLNFTYHRVVNKVSFTLRFYSYVNYLWLLTEDIFYVKLENCSKLFFMLLFYIKETTEMTKTDIFFFITKKEEEKGRDI